MTNQLVYYNAGAAAGGKRMKKIACKVISPFKYLNAQIVWPILAALFIYLVTDFFLIHKDSVKQEIAISNLELKIKDLDMKLADLKAATVRKADSEVAKRDKK